MLTLWYCENRVMNYLAIVWNEMIQLQWRFNILWWGGLIKVELIQRSSTSPLQSFYLANLVSIWGITYIGSQGWCTELKPDSMHHTNFAEIHLFFKQLEQIKVLYRIDFCSTLEGYWQLLDSAVFYLTKIADAFAFRSGLLGNPSVLTNKRNGNSLVPPPIQSAGDQSSCQHLV